MRSIGALYSQGLNFPETQMGRKTRVTQTKNTAKDEIEKSLANCVMEAGSDHETTHQAGSEAETGSDLEIISSTSEQKEHIARTDCK